MMNHSFQIGDRAEMTYCYVAPKAYSGSVTRVTPNSIHIQFDGEDKPSRFFLRNRQWRNEFGYAVLILPVRVQATVAHP
jgi:hypothetical protein